MKIKYLLLIAILILHSSVFPSCQSNTTEEEFSFILTCDMRRYAEEAYRSKEYTLGGFQAIKKVGQGSFMIITGDLDPPQATRELMDEVFGKSYPFYPAVGNHDFEVHSHIEYLRKLNRGNNSLPNVVKKGPKGCEETTYSFDWNNAHFVALNVYYDGKADTAADGNIAPELLQWLETDLAATDKKHRFVFAHDPMLTIPDMDNGAFRHQGNSLDQYPDNLFKFHQILLKYGVTAYLCGHTHSTSFSNINGIWQIDAGHIRGYEADYTPERLFQRLSQEIEKGKAKGLSKGQAITNFYNYDQKESKKVIYSLGFGYGKTYSDLTDKQALAGISEFYDKYKSGGEMVKQYSRNFWERCGWRKSSFVKIHVGKENARVEIYRDDNFAGNYALRHSQILFK